MARKLLGLARWLGVAWRMGLARMVWRLGMGMAGLELGIWLGMLWWGLGLGIRVGMVGCGMVRLGSVLGLAAVLLLSVA